MTAAATSTPLTINASAGLSGFQGCTQASPVASNPCRARTSRLRAGVPGPSIETAASDFNAEAHSAIEVASDRFWVRAGCIANNQSVALSRHMTIPVSPVDDCHSSSDSAVSTAPNRSVQPISPACRLPPHPPSGSQARSVSSIRHKSDGSTRSTPRLLIMSPQERMVA